MERDADDENKEGEGREEKSYRLRHSLFFLIVAVLFSQLLLGVINFVLIRFLFVIEQASLVPGQGETLFAHTLIFVIGGIVSLFIIVYLILRWYFDYYTIAEYSLSHSWGVLFRNTETYDYQSIRSVGVQQSFVGRIFQYGTIRMESPLISHTIVIYSVRNPHIHAKFIEDRRLKMIEDKPMGTITPVI